MQRLRFIVLSIAVILSACSGYFSVFGLSQLFGKAGYGVLIMAAALEIAKLVMTTALHRYWRYISVSLKVYLTVSVAVLMLITSTGIYGFLSNGYQQTANKLDTNESAVSILNVKKDGYLSMIENNKSLIGDKKTRLATLNSLRSVQENRMSEATEYSRKNTRKDITNLTSEVRVLSLEIDSLSKLNGVMLDSINGLSGKIAEINNSGEISAEIGPLKFISSVSGLSMGSIVNILILLLIFVFDPLALAMLVVSTKIVRFERMYKRDEAKEEDENAIDEPEQTVPSVDNPTDDAPKDGGDEKLELVYADVDPNTVSTVDETITETEVTQTETPTYSEQHQNIPFKRKVTNLIERIGRNKTGNGG